MIYPHENMPIDDLVTLVHNQGAIWFSNPNLLLLEELIRRARKGEQHGRQDASDLPGVPASAGADVERSLAGRTSAGHPDDADKWRDWEAKAEVHAQGSRLLDEPGED
jgi:hypothetical protein